jgi:hypothetical protein
MSEACQRDAVHHRLRPHPGCCAGGGLVCTAAYRHGRHKHVSAAAQACDQLRRPVTSACATAPHAAAAAAAAVAIRCRTVAQHSAVSTCMEVHYTGCCAAPGPAACSAPPQASWRTRRRGRSCQRQSRAPASLPACPQTCTARPARPSIGANCERLCWHERDSSTCRQQARDSSTCRQQAPTCTCYSREAAVTEPPAGARCLAVCIASEHEASTGAGAIQHTGAAHTWQHQQVECGSFAG